jgi:nitrile hydratase accessory protein
VTAHSDILGAEATGPAALPRRNGELVFDAPWESRAFGTAVAMAQTGVYALDEMRDLLIVEIGNWERTHGSADDSWSYYECWLAALEHLLARRILLDSNEIDQRMREITLDQASEHDHHHAASPWNPVGGPPPC